MSVKPTDFSRLIRQESERAISVSQRLLQVPPLDGGEITKQVIPPVRGIYLWRLKNSEEIVYVGVALEVFGLRRTIEGQDLMPSYQKSTFRGKVASEYRLKLGPKSVQFILDNYALAYLPCPDEVPVTLRLAQLLLIAACGPKYNDCPNIGYQ